MAQGGDDSADITVNGPELALHNLRNWLRYRVGGVGDLKRMKLGDARDLTLRAARTLANDALDRAWAEWDKSLLPEGLR